MEAPLYYHAFAPVVDGAVLEDDPAALFEELASGRRKFTCEGCGYMTGVTRSEGFLYVGDDADGVGQLDPVVFNHILDGFVQNNYGRNMHAGWVAHVEGSPEGFARRRVRKAVSESTGRG